MQNNHEQETFIPIEQYLKLQQEFAEKEQRIEERLWLDATVSQFDNILRLNYDKSTVAFSKIVLDYSAELTKAYAGVFYISDNDTQLIRAIAGYACVIDKLAQTEFQIGEGIVGQAMESKKMIFFEELPAKNIEIKSSTLNIGAASILIIPLVFNDRAFGVIELVFLRNLESKYLQLLEVVSRNVAAMLESITNNELTKQLLKQSQEQSESLRAQEEELRQNMEELQATQEVMRQKSIEIENRFTALNNSKIASIEFDLKSNIIDVNEAFLSLFGYEKEEIIGKKHKIFVEQTYAESSAYQVFWDELKNGIAQTGEFKRLNKSGSEIYLMGAYSIITDIEGNPIRIFKLATDITHTKKLLIQSQNQTEILKKAQMHVQKKVSEIQEKELYMNSLINATTDSILTIDREYKLVYSNEALNRTVAQSGWVMEKGFDTMQFYPDAQKPIFRNYYERAFAGESFDVVEEFASPDSTTYVNISYAPLFNEAKDVVGVVIFSKNITDMVLVNKRAEALLAESKKQSLTLKNQEQYITDVINATTTSICTIDQNYNLITFNTAFIEGTAQLGVTVGKGDNLLEAFGEVSKPFYDRAFAGENVELDTEYGGKYFRVKYSPIKNDKKKIVGVSIFSDDITAQVLLQEETKHLLDESQKQAEELRAQEEELRQNMEELAATQEAMAQKQTELDKIKQEEAQRTNKVAEMQKKTTEKLALKLKETQEELKKLKESVNT